MDWAGRFSILANTLDSKHADNQCHYTLGYKSLIGHLIKDKEVTDTVLSLTEAPGA